MRAVQAITVRAKLIGHRGPVIAPLSITLAETNVTAHDLFAAVVRAQIEAFTARKQEAVLLKVLSEREIDEGRVAGKIAVGGQDQGERAKSVEACIDAVITAFRDGLFFAFVDGAQIVQLDQMIVGASEVMFIRLVPLAGG